MVMRKGLGVGWWPWVCRGAAVLVLVSAPARAEPKAAGDVDLRQRVEHLEEQLKAREKEQAEGAKLGGHIGFAVPIVTSDGSHTTTVNEDFAIAFPMGITVKKSGPWAFDLELVPSINNHDVELTVHPGVLYAIDENWTAGLRMGFDIQQNSWGPTPLINRKICDLTENTHLFVELPVPIRIKSDNSATVTAALHFGIGF